MNKKFLKRIFPFIAILLLAPWPIAYGYAASGAATGQETPQITVAESSAAPSVSVFGKAISGVKAGDLFYINTANQTSDIKFTLYITNTPELIHNYRYLILKVGVYVKDNSGGWIKALLNDGNPIPDTFITLQNGHVSFDLAANVSYKLTIDSGSVNCNCITTNAEGGSFSPQFYLEVD